MPLPPSTPKHARPEASARVRLFPASVAPPPVTETSLPHASSPGRRLLSRSRANVRDLLYFGRGIPSFTHSRQVDLSPLMELREQASTRVGWAALFLRAYGLASLDWPILRQCYMRWPWPHLYEHTHSVAMVAVQRTYHNEPWLFFGRIDAPEFQTLADIQCTLHSFQTEPVETTFRVQLRQSGLPLVWRRSAFAFAYYLFARKRAKHFGTFGLTTIGSRGATIDTPPTINSATFSYGPIDSQGRCQLSVAYDHRLIDGSAIADLLADIETLLHGPVRDELAAGGSP